MFGRLPHSDNPLTNNTKDLFWDCESAELLLAAAKVILNMQDKQDQNGRKPVLVLAVVDRSEFLMAYFVDLVSKMSLVWKQTIVGENIHETHSASLKQRVVIYEISIS